MATAYGFIPKSSDVSLGNNLNTGKRSFIHKEVDHILFWNLETI